VEGASLGERLEREGPLPAAEATRILRDVADGLAQAHRHGVVHRDVKPDNVMLAGRNALLVDFGVAKAMSDAVGQRDLTSVGIALGTPAYMAPEQVAADPRIDHRADIYSAGVLAYEMIAGAPSRRPAAVVGRRAPVLFEAPFSILRGVGCRANPLRRSRVVRRAGKRTHVN
jgi:eukaryotic-like serine/threonine-protein kinase